MMALTTLIKVVLLRRIIIVAKLMLRMWSGYDDDGDDLGDDGDGDHEVATDEDDDPDDDGDGDDVAKGDDVVIIMDAMA